MLVDLHVHLRGTLLAATAERLSIRNSIAIPTKVLAAPGYGWNDFSSFLTAYDNVTAVISTARDLEEVTYEYLKTSRHAEQFMLNSCCHRRTLSDGGLRLTTSFKLYNLRPTAHVKRAGSNAD